MRGGVETAAEAKQSKAVIGTTRTGKRFKFADGPYTYTIGYFYDKSGNSQGINLNRSRILGSMRGESVSLPSDIKTELMIDDNEFIELQKQLEVQKLADEKEKGKAPKRYDIISNWLKSLDPDGESATGSRLNLTDMKSSVRSECEDWESWTLTGVPWDWATKRDQITEVLNEVLTKQIEKKGQVGKNLPQKLAIARITKDYSDGTGVTFNYIKNENHKIIRFFEGDLYPLERDGKTYIFSVKSDGKIVDIQLFNSTKGSDQCINMKITTALQSIQISIINGLSGGSVLPETQFDPLDTVQDVIDKISGPNKNIKLLLDARILRPYERVGSFGAGPVTLQLVRINEEFTIQPIAGSKREFTYNYLPNDWKTNPDFFKAIIQTVKKNVDIGDRVYIEENAGIEDNVEILGNQGPEQNQIHIKVGGNVLHTAVKNTAYVPINYTTYTTSLVQVQIDNRNDIMCLALGDTATRDGLQVQLHEPSKLATIKDGKIILEEFLFFLY